MHATSILSDFDRLMLIGQGHAAFQLLWAGAELDLFSKLSKTPGLTVDQIASELDLKAQPARILLVGLTALGLLKKQGDGYSNADVSEEHLVRDKEDNILGVLGWQNHICYPGLADFLPSLKEGKNVGLRHFPGDGNTLYQRLQNHPEIEKVFQDAMSSLSRQANRKLVDVVDLTDSKHLMDVGGGDGTNAIAFAKKFPHLNVTVFDSDTICAIARKNIESAGLTERIDTVEGNMFSTPYPDGIDAIIYCHMFTIYTPEKNIEILKKTYDALPAGGKAIIFNMMGHDDESGPMSTALGSPYFLAIATGEGMLYAWSDYEAWFREAGFTGLSRIDGLPVDHGVFIAKK
ncbi:methyltransferase [Stieleria maiorica]|nr:methyltransferase [Stieleria maiorica]